MSEHGFESNSEWEFEETGDTIWREADWRDYLKGIRQGIDNFINFYRVSQELGIEIGEIAKQMGWGSLDMITKEETAQNTEANSEIGASEPNQFSDLDLNFAEIEGSQYFEGSDEPYTIHKHPFYIMTIGLYEYIQENWESFMEDHPESVNASCSWKMANSIKEGEKNLILALHALETGDYSLVLCHIKHFLVAHNISLHAIALIPTGKIPQIERIRSALFDLREAWLRMMVDCREAENF